MKMKSVALITLLSLSFATVYFQEEFDDTWRDRWVQSQWKSDLQGKWVHSAGNWYGEESRDKGIQTSEHLRFYSISTKFPEFTNVGKDLIISFTLKFEQNIDCGGGYIKLLPHNFDQSNWGGDSQYVIMFGPDICGATRRTHMILHYKGNNLEKKDEIRVESDQFTHLYTLHIKADQTYEVFIDQASAAQGSLEQDWEFLPPKTIKDPNVIKPADWIDDALIHDPNDVKPENWDDIPQYIKDPAATQPDDWDTENDGEWEAPLVENPEYKGPWKARYIENPAYKGHWIHPTIPNPDYVEDPNLHVYKIGGVGIDIWQVKSGTIYDNIFVGDKMGEYEAFVEKTWKAMKNAEREMKVKVEQEQKNMPPKFENQYGMEEDDFGPPSDEEMGYNLREDL